VLKISKKRAYVDATITATAASDIFTQDLDDLEDQKPENGKDLADEALKDREPLEGEEDSNVHHEPTQEELLDFIKTIVFALNPDKLPYFTDSEKAMEKAIAEGAENLQALKNQCERLRTELFKREGAYERIPFEDDIPAMYKEPEDTFQDDIPF